MLRLSQLYHYPLKSGAPQALQSSWVDGLGLLGDRRWMAVDTETGRFLSQRLVPQMSQVIATYGADQTLILQARGAPTVQVAKPDEQYNLRQVSVWSDTLQVPDAGDEAANWLTHQLGRACRLVYVSEQQARQVDLNYAQAGDKVAFADGFPLLLIGQGSLDDLSARIGTPQSMLRFRPNLVIEGAPAFAEDQWQRIRIGEVTFDLVKPCSRCILTTVDPLTGQRSEDREPLTTLKRYRQRDGQVYFGQNLLARGAGMLEVGMPVELL